jgi:hypothetical protein
MTLWTPAFAGEQSTSVVPAPLLFRHPGEGRDLTLSVFRTGEIPAFAGMTML